MLRTTLEKASRKDPYSVAMLYSYMYHKEHEVNRLTIAIECIRYGVAQTRQCSIFVTINYPGRYGND